MKPHRTGVSLADVRPLLSPRPMEWVDAVLAGESNDAFAKRTGLTRNTVVSLGRYVAEAAGFEVVGMAGMAPIREAVLRMRIKELER